MKLPLDLVARRVVMASFLYYSLDTSIVDDKTYDKWCRRLARRWDSLSRFHKWQLGSPEDIKATGYHVRITHAALGGARAWLQAEGIPVNRKFLYSTPPEYSKRYRVQWWYAGAFTLGEPLSTGKRKRVRL